MLFDELVLDFFVLEVEYDNEDIQMDEFFVFKKKMLFIKKLFWWLEYLEEILKNFDRKSQRKRFIRVLLMLLKRWGIEIVLVCLVLIDVLRWVVKV